MKTTIDLTDDLAYKAKQLAAKRGITLRAVIEDGIRLALDHEQQARTYRLPDRSVNGNGLQEEFRRKPFSAIREAAYEGKSS